MNDDRTEREDDYIGTISFATLGEPGVANEANHVIMRAAFVTLLEGRPQNALALGLYRAVEAQPPIRWFGVFIRTAGDRILYFPSVEVEVAGGRKSLTVDHITLHRGRHRWYFTAPRSRDHKFGGLTRKFADGRIGWCGITLSEEALLPPLLSQTVLRGAVPRGYKRKRIDEFVIAAKAARHHIIRQPESGEPGIGSPHFMFTLARTGEEVRRPERIFIPQSKDLARPIERHELRGQMHISPVRLDAELTIQVAALTLPVQSASRVIFCAAPTRSET